MIYKVIYKVQKWINAHEHQKKFSRAEQKKVEERRQVKRATGDLPLYRWAKKLYRKSTNKNKRVHYALSSGI